MDVFRGMKTTPWIRHKRGEERESKQTTTELCYDHVTTSADRALWQITTERDRLFQVGKRSET